MASEPEGEPEDYVEEKTTADGTHIRKEVHQGNGFKSVRITSDGGSGGAIPSMFGGGGGIPDMMAAMLNDMAGGPPGMGGAPPGMVIRKRVSMPMPLFDDDDDDDDGIPPEILDLIRMTSMMNSRSMGGFGGGPMIKISKREVNKSAEGEDEIPHDHAIELAEPRHEESHEDILAKMNKLSDEISDKHEKRRKYETVDSKSQRLLQVLIIGGIMIFGMILSFAMTCKNYGKEQEKVEDEVSNQPRPVRKAD